jgi:uncharacterized protein involved in exopolysaccharide biosynthesis
MSRRPHVLRSILLAELLVLIVAGAAVAANLYADRQQEVYGGRAEILYEGQEIRTAAEGERQIATQLALLESASTLEPVARRFGITIDDLGDDLSVSSEADSNVIRATVANGDPALAVQMTQALAESYTEQVRAADSPEIEQAKSFLGSRIARLSTELTELEERYRRAGSQTRATLTASDEQLLAAMQSVLGRIDSLQDRLTELQVLQLTDDGARILTPAYLLDAPLEPQPQRAAAAGGLAGLFLACLVLLVVARGRREA